MSAYLPLLEVLPARQVQGIGPELIRRALAGLDDLYMMDVGCDAGVQLLYESLGFGKSAGASQRRFDKQSGGARNPGR